MPVRRKLAVVSVAYLAGIYLTKTVVFPAGSGIVCAFSLLWALFRLRRRKSALLCFALFAVLAGNLFAGAELQRSDEPTGYGVHIQGRISAIEKPYRVFLSDVVIDGQRKTERPVLVTLMSEENADWPPEPVIGQQISGIGRLFAPDQKRNPGGIDWRIQAICDGYELSGYILPGWATSGDETFSVREVFRRWRTFWLEHISEVFGGNAPFFQGIMLGSKLEMDDQLLASMRLTGIAHVLTVSGLHLTLIAVILRRILGCMPISRGICSWISCVCLVLFAGVTGGAPGTIRACVMTMLRERAALRGRRYEPLTALAVSALAMTLFRPLWVFDASFQFSFLVVLGIMLLSRSMGTAIEKMMHAIGMPTVLCRTTAISSCAQIAALPLQLMLYGYVPLLALPMNILSGTMVPGLMAAGWLCGFAGLLHMPAAKLMAVPVSFLAVMFERVSIWFASVQGCIWRLPAPMEATVLLCFAFLILSSRSICFGRGRKFAAFAICAVMTLGYLPRFDLHPQYVQLDVGQGDAAVIRNGRRAVLSDVGPEDSYDMIRYLRHEGLFVDTVILSHLDEDHAGALTSLLNSEIEIPSIVIAERAENYISEEEIIEALDAAKAKGIPVHTVRQGSRMSINGIDMDVLSPEDELDGSNERSLLIHAQLNGVSMILTGDLPQNCEPAVVPGCDILKVAHHGSKYATSDAFVDMTMPRIAVISVSSANPYGHPTHRVLDRLQHAGASVFRTDERGTVTILLDPNDLKVKTFLSGDYSLVH